MGMVQFEFEGNTFEANADCLRSYKTVKAITMLKTDGDPISAFKLFEAIFNGHDEEYADMLDDDIEKMGELLVAATEAVGAKNS